MICSCAHYMLPTNLLFSASRCMKGSSTTANKRFHHEHYDLSVRVNVIHLMVKKNSKKLKREIHYKILTIEIFQKMK